MQVLLDSDPVCCIRKRPTMRSPSISAFALGSIPQPRRADLLYRSLTVAAMLLLLATL